MHNTLSYTPLVSVALTTFNGGAMLREQLESILHQSYPHYEVAMSDDGSDETTRAILDEFCARDKRFRWERSPLDRGFIKNTQNAIRMCRGEIIVLCDQDDVWFPNKLLRHVEAYQDPTVMWAFNRCVLTDQAGKEIGLIEDMLPDYYRHKTMLENAWGTCIGAAQTSYRAGLLKSVMPIPSYVPAHDSWIQLAIYPAKPFFIDEITNTYRQHDHNMVGLKNIVDPELHAAREKQAIRENMEYIRKLTINRQLSLKKRFVFFLVYLAKRARMHFYRLLGSEKYHW